MNKEYRLNPKRVKCGGRFEFTNIVADINPFLPKELKLDIYERGILTLLWTYSNQNDEVSVSIQTLADKLDVSLRTVKNKVASLVDKGWIINLHARYDNSKIRKLVIPKDVQKIIDGACGALPSAYDDNKGAYDDKKGARECPLTDTEYRNNIEEKNIQYNTQPQAQKQNNQDLNIYQDNTYPEDIYPNYF